MAAIQKKVCMLGAFAVGKTSLVSQFVHSMFSEKYHSTIGVKVDKKTIDVDDQAVNLVLWDLAGEDEIQKVSTSYLRGASGYLLVIDRTRRATADTAADLVERFTEAVGPVPFVAVFNKSDLTDEQEIDDEAMAQITTERQWESIAGSAKTGEGVEEAFDRLARMITA